MVAFEITGSSPAVKIEWHSDSLLTLRYPRASNHWLSTPVDGFPKIEAIAE